MFGKEMVMMTDKTPSLRLSVNAKCQIVIESKTLHLAVFRSSLWRVCKLFLTTQKSLKLSVWGFFDNLLEFQKAEKQMTTKPIIDYFQRV